MSLLSSFTNHVFRKYNITSDDRVVYIQLENDIQELLNTEELEISKSNIIYAYNKLGGNKFLESNYIYKYDLSRYYTKSQNLLIASLVLFFGFAATTLAGFILAGISQFIGTSSYNVELSFLGSEPLLYIDIAFYYYLVRLGIYFIAVLVLLLVHSKLDSFKAILISLVSGIVSFPFGLVLIGYGLYRLFIIFRSLTVTHYFKIAVCVVISLAFITYSQILISPFREFDQRIYDFEHAGLYRIIMVESTYPSDDHFIVDESVVHISMENGKIFEVDIEDSFINPSSLDGIIDNSTYTVQYFINGYPISDKISKSYTNNTHTNVTIDYTFNGSFDDYIPVSFEFDDHIEISAEVHYQILDGTYVKYNFFLGSFENIEDNRFIRR